VLTHDPHVLSVKIGINDVWRQLDGTQPGVLIDEYRATYGELLARTRRALPACRVVLCEPSVIWPPASPDGRGQALLGPYVAAVRELATSVAADAVVPLHAAFARARAARPDVDWAPDGVHPSGAGHMLIAAEWLRAVGHGA